VLCAGSTLLLVKSHATAFIWRQCWSVTKLVGINLRKCGSFSYWFDNLGFTTEGRLGALLITPSSWGSQRSVIYMPSHAVLCDSLILVREDHAPGPLDLSDLGSSDRPVPLWPGSNPTCQKLIQRRERERGGRAYRHEIGFQQRRARVRMTAVMQGLLERAKVTRCARARRVCGLCECEHIAGFCREDRG
jgi:hypothetical protein